MATARAIGRSGRTSGDGRRDRKNARLQDKKDTNFDRRQARAQKRQDKRDKDEDREDEKRRRHGRQRQKGQAENAKTKAKKAKKREDYWNGQEAKRDKLEARLNKQKSPEGVAKKSSRIKERQEKLSSLAKTVKEGEVPMASEGLSMGGFKKPMGGDIGRNKTDRTGARKEGSKLVKKGVREFDKEKSDKDELVRLNRSLMRRKARKGQPDKSDLLTGATGKGVELEMQPAMRKAAMKMKGNTKDAEALLKAKAKGGEGFSDDDAKRFKDYFNKELKKEGYSDKAIAEIEADVPKLGRVEQAESIAKNKKLDSEVNEQDVSQSLTSLETVTEGKTGFERAKENGFNGFDSFLDESGNIDEAKKKKAIKDYNDNGPDDLVDIVKDGDNIILKTKRKDGQGGVTDQVFSRADRQAFNKAQSNKNEVDARAKVVKTKVEADIAKVATANKVKKGIAETKRQEELADMSDAETQRRDDRNIEIGLMYSKAQIKRDDKQQELITKAKAEKINNSKLTRVTTHKIRRLINEAEKEMQTAKEEGESDAILLLMQGGINGMKKEIGEFASTPTAQTVQPSQDVQQPRTQADANTKMAELLKEREAMMKASQQ
tara:strand:+ start:1019 stop:2830 length:1812 start_codon:yes stop_codon:yes gene_type:complete